MRAASEALNLMGQTFHEGEKKVALEVELEQKWLLHAFICLLSCREDGEREKEASGPI